MRRAIIGWSSASHAGPRISSSFVCRHIDSTESLKAPAVFLSCLLNHSFDDILPERSFVLVRDMREKRYEAGLVDPLDHLLCVRKISVRVFSPDASIVHSAGTHQCRVLLHGGHVPG